MAKEDISFLPFSSCIRPAVSNRIQCSPAGRNVYTGPILKHCNKTTHTMYDRSALEALFVAELKRRTLPVLRLSQNRVVWLLITAHQVGNRNTPLTATADRNALTYLEQNLQIASHILSHNPLDSLFTRERSRGMQNDRDH